MNVILVEDDLLLSKGLIQALTEMGHVVQSVHDGRYADTLIAAEHYDLVVLDLGLPVMDGLEVLRRLRSRKQTVPVLILSARDHTTDRVLGLNEGADDYLTKPFELTEFEARVRALLRRGQGASTQLGKLVWLWNERAAYCNDVPLALSLKELVVLESFMQQPGRMVAKEILASRLGDQDGSAGDNTVEVYIHRLRKKLEPAALEIRTVRGLGYVLRELS
ncbi:response regulator [Leeia oryzae]|uniref:response regulator n=1 Tax=Leeia oryzae TaxID=356662 RepID=UPI000369F229|nr:response regulator [Leeia oryzae]